MKKIIESDILDSIKANLMVGNITQDDYNQLIELTNQLYEQIIRHYQEKGGDSEMKPLLPGAMPRLFQIRTLLWLIHSYSFLYILTA